jgi:hypothetical protein
MPAVLGILCHNTPFLFTRNSSHWTFNPSNAELNPISHLLALEGARHFVHVSRIRVNMANTKGEPRYEQLFFNNNYRILKLTQQYMCKWNSFQIKSYIIVDKRKYIRNIIDFAAPCTILSHIVSFHIITPINNDLLYRRVLVISCPRAVKLCSVEILHPPVHTEKAYVFI